MSASVRALIILVMICSNTESISQALEIDSLEREVLVANDVNKVKIIRELLQLYQYSNIPRSLQYVEQAIQLSNKNHDSSALKRLVCNKAQLLCRQGNFLPLRPLLAPWIADANLSSLELGHMLSLVGIGEVVQGNYVNALKYFERALLVPPTVGGVQIRDLFNNIGMVYYKLRENRKASYFFAKAISNGTFDTRPFEESFAYFNLGLAWGEMGQLDTAEKLIRSSIGLCEIDDRSALLPGLFGLGQVTFRRGKIVESDSILTLTLRIAERENDNRNVAECLVLLARIRARKSENGKALVLLKRCEELCVKLGYKEILLHCFQTMVQAFQANRNSTDAAIYQAKVIELYSALKSQDVIESLYLFEVDLMKRRNDEILYGQTKHLQIQTTIAINQEVEYYAIITFLTMLMGATLLLYRLYKIKCLINKKLRLRAHEREVKIGELDQTRDDSFDENVFRIRQLASIIIMLKCNEESLFGRKINALIIELQEIMDRLANRYKY